MNNFSIKFCDKKIWVLKKFLKEKKCEIPEGISKRVRVQ